MLNTIYKAVQKGAKMSEKARTQGGNQKRAEADLVGDIITMGKSHNVG